VSRQASPNTEARSDVRSGFFISSPHPADELALRSQNTGDAVTMKSNLSNLEDADLASPPLGPFLQ
jgi:hypothetical protein